MSKKNGETTLSPLIGAAQKRAFTVIAGVVVFMTVTTYTGQRIIWMGDENSNLKAKEYFVAGQTLNSYKAILTTLLHPELPIITPFTKMQWLIYEKGVALLPENEGEAGVWQNMWFHHHFGKKDRSYFGVKDYEPSPKMIRVLDQYWFCLESMATKPFADKEMEEKYLEGFAGLAFSYTLAEGFYSGIRVGSVQRMANLSEHVKRSKFLVQWLNELRTKWNVYPTVAQTVGKNPKLQVLAQLTLLGELQDIIKGAIHNREFSCDLSSIQQYIQVRKEFYAPDNGKPAYKRIMNPRERKAVYYIAIDAVGPKDTKYLIEHYCGFEVVGKVDMTSVVSFARAKNVTPKEQEEFERRASLSDEIKIIEEKIKETRGRCLIVE